MNEICTFNNIFVSLYYCSLTYCNYFLNFKTKIMKIIDVRPKQSENGRRKTLKRNFYVHPKSKYIGNKVRGGYGRDGSPFKDWFCFYRQTQKLFTMNRIGNYPRVFSYGYPLAKSASNAREWYGIKIPSTGWEKVQFIYHEPITFKKENAGDMIPKFYKFLLSELK